MRISTLLLLLCLCSAPLLSQTTFQRYFTVMDSTLLGRKVVQTSDGNIAVTSVLEYYLPGQTNPIYEGLLTKMSPAGNILWTLKFDPGPALLVYADDLEATPDGGVIVLVMTKDDYTTKSHPNIVKVSALGVVEWTKSIPGLTNIYLNAIQAVADGFLVTGLNYAAHATIVFKIDGSGNMLWGKNISNVLVLADRAAEDEDGNLYLPGGLNINNSPQGATSTPLLIKMSGDGDLIWSKTYQDPFSNTTPAAPFQRLRKCLLHQDSLLLFSNNFTTQDLVVTKTDLDGMPAIQKRFKMAGPESTFPILNAFPTASGDITVGTFNSHIDNRPALFQLTPDLEMNWIKSYGKKGVDLYTFSDLQKLRNEEGFLMTGPFYEMGLQKISVVKTDMRGEFAGLCCARDETVFQGITTPVTASDTALTELNFPVFVDGTVITHKVDVQSFPICEAPATSMIALSDTLICPGSCIEVRMVSSEQNTTYSWTFPHAMPDTSSAVNPGKVCYGDRGVFPVFLRQEGCLIDSSQLTVDGRPEMFPNAFTPNGDGTNDVFRPIGQCPVEEYRLQVFNRWGERIFESLGINEGWNGDVNGVAAPVDVYIYQVEYYAIVNGVRTLLHNGMKEVTLLR